MDVADEPFSLRHARWRAWVRVHTPNVLYYRFGLVVPKAKDCGKHDWHNAGDGLDGCYHCVATRRTTAESPWHEPQHAKTDGIESQFGHAKRGGADNP